MTDRHDAALRAALAERDRLHRQCVGDPVSQMPIATDYIVTRIVEAALAAADVHDGAPLLCINCWQPMSLHTALAHCRGADQ